MAGIYLPGREMPRSCYFCDFIFRDTADKKVYCTESGCHKETWLDLSDTLANSRHEDCPLVFVPDHGDFQLMLEELVGESTTIIPADKEEEA